MRTRLVAGVGVVGLVAGLWVGTAAADPVKSGSLTLFCDNGMTYQAAVAPGHGDFTPALDLGSTGALIPVSFGPETGEIRDPAGNLIESFTLPGTQKGQAAKNARDLITCSFTITNVNDGSDPDSPVGSTFTGRGTIVFKATPSR